MYVHRLSAALSNERPRFKGHDFIQVVASHEIKVRKPLATLGNGNFRGQSHERRWPAQGVAPIPEHRGHSRNPMSSR